MRKITKPQIVTLQSLRALAFLDIFLAHCEIMPTATIGVSIFLIMSGFLMAYQYYERNIESEGFCKSIEFAYQKIGKLYPLHIVTLVFVATIKTMGAIKTDIEISSIARSAGVFLANVLCVQSWIPNRSIYFSYNAVSWYLSTIIFSYFLFSLLWYKLRNIKDEKLIVFAIATVAIMLIISLTLNQLVSVGLLHESIFHSITYVNPIYRFGDFFEGVLLGIFYERYLQAYFEKKYNSYVMTGLAILVLAVVICLIYLYYSEMLPNCIKFSLVWMPVSMLVVLLFSIGRGKTVFIANAKCLRGLGDVSGECFLIHLIIVRVLQKVLENKILVASVGLVLTILFSMTWRKGMNGFKLHIKSRAN